MRSITTWDHFKEANPRDIEDFFSWVWNNSGRRGDIANAESLMIRKYDRSEKTVIQSGYAFLETVTVIDFSYWTPKTPDGYGHWMTMEITRRPNSSSKRIERLMSPSEVDEEAYAAG